MTQLTTTAYLILRPTYSRVYEDKVNGFTVEGVRKKRPTGEAAAGAVVIALTIAMPARAFEPLRPAVEITVPDGAYDIVPDVTVAPPPPED